MKSEHWILGNTYLVHMYDLFLIFFQLLNLRKLNFLLVEKNLLEFFGSYVLGISETEKLNFLILSEFFGVGYAHHITTVPLPGFSDLTTIFGTYV